MLDVKNLKMHFPVYGGILRRQVASVFAVDGVDILVQAGETLGLPGRQSNITFQIWT